MSIIKHRAEHVGSLLRPPQLLQAYSDYDDGTISVAELHTIENRWIREAIQLQESIGLPIVTDGEFRRVIYFGHFTSKVQGFTMMESEIAFDEGGRKIKYHSPAVTGLLRREQGIATDEFAYLKAHTSKLPKVTLPSPADQHMFRFREGVSDVAYPDLEVFFADVVQIYRAELADLAASGATYVQLDDTTFTLFCDAKWRQRVIERGYDPDSLIDRYIRLINDCIAERPAGLTVAMHMCRGNNQGEWLFSGGYDAVAEKLFSSLHIDRFLLEYDTERSGTFEPLRFMPRDKFVVLGLITSKSPELEAESDLLKRIDEAGKVFPHVQMGISPQCGFASTAPGNPLTPDDQKRKLERVVSVAQKAWGEV